MCCSSSLFIRRGGTNGGEFYRDYGTCWKIGARERYCDDNCYASAARTAQIALRISRLRISFKFLFRWTNWRNAWIVYRRRRKSGDFPALIRGEGLVTTRRTLEEKTKKRKNRTTRARHPQKAASRQFYAVYASSVSTSKCPFRESTTVGRSRSRV